MAFVMIYWSLLIINLEIFILSGGLEFNGGSNFIAFYGGLFQLNASIASTGDIYAGSDSGSLVAGASGYVVARGKYFIPVAGAYSSTKYYLREA